MKDSRSPPAIAVTTPSSWQSADETFKPGVKLAERVVGRIQQRLPVNPEDEDEENDDAWADEWDDDPLDDDDPLREDDRRAAS